MYVCLIFCRWFCIFQPGIHSLHFFRTSWKSTLVVSIRLNPLLLWRSRALASLVGRHRFISQFSKFLIDLLGYCGGTRTQVPAIYHPIRQSFTSCCPVPVTWTPRLDLWGPCRHIYIYIYIWFYWMIISVVIKYQIYVLQLPRERLTVQMDSCDRLADNVISITSHQVY